MLSLRILAVALALVAASSAARAERAPAVPVPFAKCSIHHKAKFHRRFDQLPKIIQKDILEHVGAIAEPNEEYNAGDVFIEGDTTLTRRFMGAIQREDTWVVWYEHGGRGEHLHIVGYQVGFVTGYPPQPSPNPMLLGNMYGAACRATDALLDGIVPAPDW